jgi:hypothetical protein
MDVKGAQKPKYKPKVKSKRKDKKPIKTVGRRFIRFNHGSSYLGVTSQ